MRRYESGFELDKSVDIDRGDMDADEDVDTDAEEIPGWDSHIHT